MIGYGLWLILTQHQTIINKISVPVFFYKIPYNTKLTAPDSVNITIQGQKQTLHSYTTEHTGIHIDLSDYHQGNHLIHLQKDNLFLPDEVNLLNLSPSVIQVQLEKIE